MAKNATSNNTNTSKTGFGMGIRHDVDVVRGKKIRGLDLSETVLPAAKFEIANGLTNLSLDAVAMPFIRPVDKDGDAVLTKDEKHLASRRPNRELGQYAGRLMEAAEGLLQEQITSAIAAGGETLKEKIAAMDSDIDSVKSRLEAQESEIVKRAVAAMLAKTATAPVPVPVA